MIRLSEGPTRLKMTGESRELRAISKALRYHPKGYYFSPRYQAYEMTDGREGWDGFISPLVISDDGAEAECLRGHKDRLVQTAREMGFNVSQRDCIKPPFGELNIGDLPEDLIEADFQLDEYQKDGIVYWLKHGMGVNKIAVNGGKTAMFAAAASMINRKFPDDRVLYITQSERLVRQAYQEIRKFLPGWNITQYGGNRKDNTGTEMVISTVAMLWKNHAQLVAQKWFDNFIAVLFDESHHATSKTATKILLMLPAYFRLGASDTSKEKDPAQVANIRGLLGPIRYVVPVSTYIQSGRSAKPTIYIVENPKWKDKYAHLPHHAVPGTSAWALIGNEWRKGTYIGPVYERDKEGNIKMRKRSELDDEVDENDVYDEHGRVETVKSARWTKVEVPITVPGYHVLKFPGDPQEYEVESTYCLLKRVGDDAIVRFKERNDLIADWTQYYSEKRNFPTLVVCTRTLHIYILESLLQDRLGEEKVRVLMGEHTTRERDETFNWFRNTSGAVLISPLVQEGVSINELRAGVIADYVGDWERANQIIGRFIRKKTTMNEAHITWFFDNQHETMRRGSQRLLVKLIDIRAYKFAYPLIGPGTIKSAKVYESLA